MDIGDAERHLHTHRHCGDASPDPSPGQMALVQKRHSDASRRWQCGRACVQRDVPDLPGKMGQLATLLITGICTLSASAAAAPEVRLQLLRYIPRIFSPLSSSKIARESA